MFGGVFMKISELREKLKGREKEELQALFIDLYKLIPKSIKDGKNIDALIDNPTQFKETTKKVVVLVDIDTLEREIECFTKHAYAQNYIAPNRIIPKKERSNWRTLAKRLIDQTMTLAEHEEHQGVCAILLEKLYRLFCHASSHYIFVSEEPFTTLKIPQSTFLQRVILLKKRVDAPQQWIQDSLVLILEQDTDPETSISNLLDILLEELTTTSLKEQAILICYQLIDNYKAVFAEPPKKGSRYDISGYAEQNTINTLVEMHFILQSSLTAYDKATAHFWQHYIYYSNEIKLYILLGLIKRYQHPEQWLQAYEEATTKGITPRDSLKKENALIRKNQKFTTNHYF